MEVTAADVLREDFGKGNLTEAEFRRLFELRRALEQRTAEPNRDDWKRLESDYSLSRSGFTD